MSSKIKEIKLDDGSIGLLFPKKILHGLSFLAFGTVISLMIGLIIFMPQNWTSPNGGTAIIFLFFMIGLFFVSMGVALVNMRTALIVNSTSIKLIRNVFGKEFIKEIKNGKDVNVERVVRFSTNGKEVYGARISNELFQSITVGLDISVEESAWLESIVKSQNM